MINNAHALYCNYIDTLDRFKVITINLAVNKVTSFVIYGKLNISKQSKNTYCTTA